MKHLARISCLMMLILLVVLSACGKGATTPPPSSQEQAYTQIWETVALGQTQTAAAASPTPQFTPTPEVSETPKPTNTPLVSSTQSGEATSAATESSSTVTKTKAPSTSQDTCDNFQYISDVTYPDGAQVQGGTTIVKTWRIKNLGPCEWNENYAITFGWGGTGTTWNTTAGAVGFGRTVKVGETVDLSMELDVPTDVGEYGAVFRTRNDKQVYFGPTLTIYIVVK